VVCPIACCNGATYVAEVTNGQPDVMTGAGSFCELLSTQNVGPRVFTIKSQPVLFSSL